MLAAELEVENIREVLLNKYIYICRLTAAPYREEPEGYDRG